MTLGDYLGSNLELFLLKTKQTLRCRCLVSDIKKLLVKVALFGAGGPPLIRSNS